jgi:hypothetical protein
MMINISIYTKISESDRKRLCRWFCQQNLEVTFEVFKTQKKHFFRLKEQHRPEQEDLNILSAAAFFLSVKEVYETIHGQNRKNHNFDLSQVSSATKLRAKQIKTKKRGDKYEKLLNLKNVVMSLIDDQGLSYRQASQYLSKYHRFSVSHTLIGEFYKNLKGEKQHD